MAKKSNIKELLEIREERKRNTPNFIRQNLYKHKKLDDVWRKPRGIHSPQRKFKKGKPARVRVGYGNPKEVRGLTKEGLKPVVIENIKQLANVDKNKEIIIISSRVGLKKKITIVKNAIQQGIKIYNIKNPEKFLQDVKELLAKKKEEREKRKKKEVKVTKRKEKEKTEEEKKKEKDKLLISKADKAES